MGEIRTVTVWGLAAGRPNIIPRPTEAPRWGRRDNNAACGSDSYGPLSCRVDSTCTTSYDSTFCQRITSHAFYSNTTTPNARIAPTTSPRPIVVTSSSSDGPEGNAEATGSPTLCPSPYDTSCTGDPSPPTPFPSDVAPDCGLLSHCHHPLASPSPTASPFIPLATTPPATMSPMAIPITVPIVIPSAFLVLCALIFSVVGKRRKWVSRAYRHLSRERQLRRSTQSNASPSADDSSYEAIPLRDLQTPPPAYSPYNFSWADYELLTVDSSHPMGNPRHSESDMIGLAYPLGDMGRHETG